MVIGYWINHTVQLTSTWIKYYNSIGTFEELRHLLISKVSSNPNLVKICLDWFKPNAIAVPSPLELLLSVLHKNDSCLLSHYFAWNKRTYGYFICKNLLKSSSSWKDGCQHHQLRETMDRRSAGERNSRHFIVISIHHFEIMIKFVSVMGKLDCLFDSRFMPFYKTAPSESFEINCIQ